MKKYLVLITSLSAFAALSAIPISAERSTLVKGDTSTLVAQPTASPISFQNMALRGENGMTFLRGQVVNRSSQPMWVNGATFRFTRRVDGRTVDYTTVNIPVVQWVAPNSEENVNALVDVRVFQTTTINLQSVDAWASR